VGIPAEMPNQQTFWQNQWKSKLKIIYPLIANNLILLVFILEPGYEGLSYSWRLAEKMVNYPL
jgi:hypothetical protein